MKTRRIVKLTNQTFTMLDAVFAQAHTRLGQASGRRQLLFSAGQSALQEFIRPLA